MSRLLTLAIAAGALLLLAPVPALAADLGTIEGTVTAPVAVDEVEVCIVEANPSETCTYPRPDGTYALAVTPGRYRVEFLPSYRSHLLRQYYNGRASLEEAVLVTVRPKEETKGIDAHLVLGGQIEGRVTAAAGADPLEDVEACALSTDGSIGGCADTGANGKYAIPTLPPGVYRLGFWGEGKSAAYATHYYSDGATFLEADPITLAAGATAARIDAQMQVGARLEARSGMPPARRWPGSPSACSWRGDPARALHRQRRRRPLPVAGPLQRLLHGRLLARIQELPAPNSSRRKATATSPSTTKASRRLPWRRRCRCSPPASSAGSTRTCSGRRRSCRQAPNRRRRPRRSLRRRAPRRVARPEAAKCKRGYRKRTVKGKVRCVKVHHRKQRQRQKGGVRKGRAG